MHHAGVQVGVSKWLKKLEMVFYSSGIALDKVSMHTKIWV